MSDDPTMGVSTPRGHPIRQTMDHASAGHRPTQGDLDASVPVYDVHTIEAFYRGHATGLGAVIMTMIASIGFMGLVITLVGLYGLVSYAVNRRTREIGIRIAIGATYARILRMLLRQGLAPAWVGMGIGVVLSLLSSRLLVIVICAELVHLATHYVFTTA